MFPSAPRTVKREFLLRSGRAMLIAMIWPLARWQLTIQRPEFNDNMATRKATIKSDLLAIWTTI